ncbi:MAG: NUDIX domain-containing protein [Blastochloris sp.]|nr:NUDIX domain-containing protein [Blastochloris sp.]
MEDIFDIVNTQDQVIGSAPRSVVHREGHLHRATHVWLYNTQGQLLIQLRAASKDKHPSVWDSSACGHVDSGEDYHRAARRETCEELGLHAAPELEEIAYCQDTAQLGQEFVRVYRGHHEGPFLPQPSEVTEVRWIDPAELSSWMQSQPESFAPSFIHLWMKYS